MLTLQRPDSKVSALMGENKGIKNGDVIRPSLFSIPFVLGDRKVVLNTFTRQCIETKYFSWFEKPCELKYDEKDTEMKDLIASDFLIARDFDEVKKYIGMLSFLRRAEKAEPGYAGYTILPTTACNARCVYCYELGLKQKTMSKEIVEQTIRYILSTKKENACINLHWFGGEPLIGERIIDRICEAMRENDVEYKSTMISNGSLMTEELAEKVRKEWHLNSVQITLDGRDEVYCERKRYPAFEGSPYKSVLKGVHAMLKHDIRVDIRLNVDEENMDEMLALTDELEEEFENDSMISIYCHSIFAEEDDDSNRANDELYVGIRKLNDRLVKFNRNRREKNNKPDENKDFYDRSDEMKRYYCMGDKPTMGPAILPDGSLYLCELIGDLDSVGTVYDETPVNRDLYIERNRLSEEKCNQCGMFPVCTDFSGCPVKIRDCYRENMERERSKLMPLETERRLPPINMVVGGKIIRVTEPNPEFIEENRDFIVPTYHKPQEKMNCDEIKELLSQ